MDGKVAIQVGTITEVGEVTETVNIAAARIRRALPNLGAIKEHAIEQAPPEWRDFYAGQRISPLADRLFLEGFEVHLTGDMTVYFDFGDLDMLAVRLYEDDRVCQVELVARGSICPPLPRPRVIVGYGACAYATMLRCPMRKRPPKRDRSARAC